MYTVIYALTALFALSFIIFLHEMGHYLAARWAGMKVETFSIGFGTPIKSWTWQGVQWQVGCIPFGGYVSIQGLSQEGKKERDQGEGSYFKVPAYKRMIVVAMGPIVNLVLAWLLFASIGILGGQRKNFADITHFIGWVDPQSEIASTVKPGDKVISYDNYSFHEAKDHLYAPLVAKENLSLSIESIDYTTGKKEPLTVKAKCYSHPEASESSVKTVGILSSARQLIIEKFSDHPLPASSFRTLQELGAKKGDKLIAVNGVRVFSDRQLVHTLNDSVVLLTVERANQVLSIRVPTFSIMQYGLNALQLSELRDWYYDANLSQALEDCQWIGYELDSNGKIRNALKLIDSHDENLWLKKSKLLQIGTLEKDDKITAVNGVVIKNSKNLLENLQQPAALVVIETESTSTKLNNYEAADHQFLEGMQNQELNGCFASITSLNQREPSRYKILAPVATFKRQDINKNELLEIKSRAGLIVEEHRRAEVERTIEKKFSERVLGIQLVDQTVLYNPGPNHLFKANFSQITRSLGALVNAQLSPKWLVGPIGMVSVVTHGLSVGATEALNWLAIISLSLGVFNLLPLPIFDGGRLLIDGLEAATGRKISPKVLDVMAYLFVTVVISIAIMATYWDLWRLWKSLG